MPEPADKPFEIWAVLELMGHVRLAGRITEEERFGTKMGRIDIPKEDGGFTTMFFGGGSVYRLTPTTEEAARLVAACCRPEPVHSWELPERLAAPAATHEESDSDYDDDYDPR